MARVYQAILHGSIEHLGRALRRSVAAAHGIADGGAPRAEHTRGTARVVLQDGPSCGRYLVEDAGARLAALWGPTSSPATAWALVSVDAPTGEAADPAARIVAGLLDAERAYDGAIPLETEPLDVDADLVTELLTRLLDPRRRVPVLVLSVDEREPALPARHAAHLARATAGLAVVARLLDKAAQDRLNNALGHGFDVYGGALRTYLADLDPATEDYPQRHPVRSGSALRDLGIRALDVVVTGVVGDALRRPLPPDVRRGLRLVPRVLDRGVAWGDAAEPESRPRPGPTTGGPPPRRRPRRETPAVPASAEPTPGTTEIPDTAGSPDLPDSRDAPGSPGLPGSPGTVNPPAADARTAAEAPPAPPGPRHEECDGLAAELARLRDDYDLLVLQYEELAEESRRAEDRIRRLNARLADLTGEPDTAPAAVPAAEVWAPDCLADVLLRARAELPHVSLPAFLDSGAATLDKAEPGHIRVWAGAAWDALRALDAYAAARSARTFRGGFRDWCRNPPHGQYALSPKKFAMKESEAVAGRTKFRKARMFPVPPEVAAEQTVFMEAHVRLRGIGNPAPRMHFHDDAAGATGRVHVGYLGHHLDNTRTN